MRRLLRLSALVALSLAASLLLPAGPAQADRPVEHDTYTDVFDELLPTPEDEQPTFCGLVNVPLHGEVHGNFMMQFRGTSRFPYFSDVFHGTFTWTNPLTGLTFTNVVTGSHRDWRIVDNGDGTITITSQSTGILKIYGPDGELLLTDRGLVRESFLIGTKGTIDPEDDVFLGPVGEPVVRGPHDTEDHTFCGDFLAATTP